MTEPKSKNVKPVDLANGITYEESLRQFNERYDIEESDIIECPAEYEDWNCDSYQLYAMGFDSYM